MLRLTRFFIENYKSLENVEIALHPRITVFVGRNNCGKSNIIDSLGFLHVLTSGSYQQAFNERGGFERVVFGQDRSRKITFKIEFDGIDHADVIQKLNTLGVPTEGLARLANGGTWGVQYSVTLNGRSFEELMELKWGPSSFPMAKGTFAAGRNYQLDVVNFPKVLENILSGGELNLLERGGNYGGEFSPGFRGPQPPNKYFEIFLSFLQPALRNLLVRVGPVRNPSLQSSISGQTTLNEGGSNLADWADYLRSNEPQRFAEFVREFVAIVPEATGLTTPRLGGPSTTVSIGESWLPDSVRFDLSASSFGERNILVMLGYLLERRPAVILSVEEPENSLHPQALRGLTRTFWRFSERQQIIISTHSPAMAACFPLESLRLVTRESAASQVVEIDATNARFVVNELGVRPSDVFDMDAIVFVEGDVDEEVFSTWFRLLQSTKEWSEHARVHVQFVAVNGLTNVPFHLDARILHGRSAKPILFTIADGDVGDSPEKQEQWRMVRRGVGLPDERVLKLENRHVIEDYLLLPEAIRRAFPGNFGSSDEVGELIRKESESGATPKKLLTKLLESKGIRYDVKAASRIAGIMKATEIHPFVKDLFLKVAVASTG